MIGRLADLFRFVWGLLYWNARKSWFRWRRSRTPCPCQSLSDSGRAFETACEACVHWERPERFRRVCPLLVVTPDGLRCSADTADVRPFWGRVLGYYGSAALAAYLAAALAIFAFLRVVGYPISIVHLVWPPSWHRVGQVRGWYFMDRSERSFRAGRPAEGMLYLRNAYEFDPSNLAVALAFAQKLQVGQAARSDQVYRDLLRAHPEHRSDVSRIWFRALLARADYAGITELARLRVLDDPTNASVWMRALLVATRETGDRETIEQLAAAPDAAATVWRRLLSTELLWRASRSAEARRSLHATWSGSPPFALYYQVSQLSELGDGLDAIGYAELYRDQLDDAARATLLLHAYALLDAAQSRHALVNSLLGGPLHPATLNVLTAHLVRHPDPTAFETVYRQFEAQRMPLVDATLEVYVGMYCAAGANGDWPRLQALAAALRSHSGGNSITLGFTEAFFRGQTTQRAAASVLPVLPVSLEMTYAMLERYPAARRPRSSVP